MLVPFHTWAHLRGSQLSAPSSELGREGLGTTFSTTLSHIHSHPLFHLGSSICDSTLSLTQAGSHPPLLQGPSEGSVPR